MPTASPDSIAPRFYVLWQFRSGQLWHSAEFGDRDAALACFFAWMRRGVAVRWKSA